MITNNQIHRKIQIFREKLEKIKSEPREALRLGFALFRGLLIKAKYRLTNPNVKIGSNFRAYTWLNIIGPGKVIIGNKVGIDLSFLRQPCIITHSKEAVVRIGKGCYLGGTRISCVDMVTIGDEALLGSSTFIDSDVIPARDTVIDAEWKRRHVRQIKIGNHFWSGTNSFILGGAIINDECVLGAGAAIQNKEAPERALMLGNPARKIGLTRSS